VVRALVYQPSGPGFDSWHVSFRVSYYKGEEIEVGAPPEVLSYLTRLRGKMPVTLFVEVKQQFGLLVPKWVPIWHLLFFHE
jgi:hypothetical protein